MRERAPSTINKMMDSHALDTGGSMLTKEQSAKASKDDNKTNRLQSFDSGELSSENFLGFEKTADAEATTVKRNPLASFLTGGLGSMPGPNERSGADEDLKIAFLSN